MIRSIPANVTPTKTALLFPQPCEKKAAKIRNDTLRKMREKDIGNVAYYLLKNKRGFSVTLFQIIALGLIFIFPPLIIFYHQLTSFGIIQGFLVGWIILAYLNIAPNIANAVRYQKTIKDCKDWLKENLDETIFNKIKELEFNDHFALHNILSKKEIEATLLYTDPHYPILRSYRNYAQIMESEKMTNGANIVNSIDDRARQKAIL